MAMSSDAMTGFVVDSSGAIIICTYASSVFTCAATADNGGVIAAAIIATTAAFSGVATGALLGAKVVAVANGGGLYKSVTTGATFAAVAAANAAAVGSYVNVLGAVASGATTTSDLSFKAVACSNDFKYIVAVTNTALISSMDSGASWAARITGSSPAKSFLNWKAVASNALGNRWIAAANGIYTDIAVSNGCSLSTCVPSNAGTTGDLYISSDWGVSWQDIVWAGRKSWAAVASSADGMTLAAVDKVASSVGGFVWTSYDGGATWAQQTAAGVNKLWSAVTVSGTGMRMVAAISGGDLFASTDKGVTWADQTVVSTYTWKGLASDYSGLTYIATAPAHKFTGALTSWPTGQPTGMPSSAPTFKAEAWGEVVWDKRRHRQGGLCENKCSSHGTCEKNMNCKCFVEANGETAWTGPDCSQRTCPRDFAWVGEVVGANDLHPWSECSNKGLCDRKTGLCSCFPGYDGAACQRTTCPYDCMLKGACWPEKHLASKVGRTYSEPWDAMKHVGCLCDAGYRGYACEFQECPSGSDPLDGYGNESGRDCSGRGLCDYNSGTCGCFSGFYGNRCQFQYTGM